MSEENITFLPYAEAVKIVAAIQEEEDIHQENRRILTVYNYEDREICWFDFQEVMDDVQSLDALLQVAGQRVVGCNAIDEAGLTTP